MVDLKLVFRELVKFEIELWDAIDARLRSECDLQLTWFEVMQLLGRLPEARVQDIAAEFSITVGGTSKVVDRLEAAGLCRRRPNPNDRRSSVIELTAKGRRLLGKAAVVFEEELQARLGDVLPERSLEQLRQTLTTLRSAGRSRRHP
ncbi:MarR family winged helix-turn-helix transcriptional regulator [Amycolatopsis vastitatis]|uniref:MarR family transcriptional regulator n=1 Tax=Amycolatopsis vastitatis TaxID=1905142 RepID=A0A229SMT9_9PSEU|nr:MarR family winged helix-turn-helix transcriptional regulator [Amycolatopsis vastitatis]OXM60001.1 MarR family transcriptional regulator [Amycolatopsis vastitatis]